MKASPIHLKIQERADTGSRRTRSIRITAESVTIGSVETVDIELVRISKNFLVEIKFSEGSWWVVNPMKSREIRVNGKRVELDHPLQHGDQIIVHEHVIEFELEKESEQLRSSFEFLPHPGSDEALWQYFLKEDEFDEIMINGCNEIFVDYKGSVLKTPYYFTSDKFLFTKVFYYTKTKTGWSSWQMNRELRIQAALPPISESPHLCIRKARKHVFSLDELEEKEFGTPEQIKFLKEAVQNKETIVISGGTSSGKTVCLRSLVQQIPEPERVLVLEEEAETNWPHPHAVTLEAGRGKLKNCLIESLRFRPDRIVISEIRGDEAFDFLQAINTGHSGSMTTLHANSAREALFRLENLALSTGLNLNPVAIRQQIAKGINILVQLTREENGKRRIETITRITGIQKSVILLSDPIGLEPAGISQGIPRIR